ncbi:hypothetical protein DFJ73DRAFT_956611 [Zopfochytrium polystomum]|nr:hypothetical protein DFJ73DRAFT_956611 [Zopfochytrium polystomum]
MDFQNRAGSKVRSGGVAGASETHVDRRERLRKLALETIDLAKDPYFMKNHLGSYECKLCLTLHSNEGSYLAHTQGKKHQTNLQRRAARDARDLSIGGGPTLAALAASGTRLITGGPGIGGPDVIVPRKGGVKIGRPGYKVTKVRDRLTQQLGLLFQIQYPDMVGLPAGNLQQQNFKPRHRFMSAYEQHVEPPNKAYQYLLIAAEPYETIAFKIQSREIDRGEGKFWTHWDPDARQFHLQFFFKVDRAPGMGGESGFSAVRGPPPGASGGGPGFAPTGANARPVM